MTMDKGLQNVYLRAFGVSGVQAAADIEAVESEYNFEILERRRSEKTRKLEGYDQFEGAVRSQASEMSEFYEIFYCLEVSIRQLVANTLEDAEGAEWWTSGRVPQDLRDYVDRLKSEEADSGVSLRSDEDLDYLTFGHLKQLITANFDVFNAVLSSRRAVERIMSQLIQLRNPIAHCCPLAEDEKERLELTVRDWFRVRS
ncbi:MAG: hypothetical protein KDK28_18010 [Maritimibacter sp.]|nr:hypothetical protein [Maritimibacter sp.]